MNKINNYFLYIDFSVVNKIFFVFLLVFGLNTVNAQVVTDTVTTGSGTFVPPSGVSSIRVEAWGAGGRGATRTTHGVGSGGGGGGYSRGLINVTPTQTYHYTVGAGGNADGGTADSSWFNATANTNLAPTSNATGVLARGGSNRADNNNTAGGGATAGYGNQVTYTGGNGAAGPNSNSNRGGGGGSSAGIGSNGTNATGTPGATAPIGGGHGGAGRNQNTQGNGNAGIAPGGGGGGAYKSGNNSTTRTGGAGARGEIVITYLPAITGTTDVVVGYISSLSNSVSGGTWSSSNPLIATVNPSTGEVTGVAPGSATITYTTPDGLSRFIVVTITGFDTQALCASPGRDGTTVTTYGGGNINTYYPGGVSVSAGATSVTVGAVPSGYGTTPIAEGDLLLIMQMQRTDINTTDTAAYGSIVYDYSVGYYEYIVAQSNVAVGGGTLTFRGAGIGNGLKYNYITFNGTGNTNRGKGRYQIIRVPQYSSVTLTQTITAPYWNGNVGGVVAMEVSNLLNFNGQTIHADGRGFRGAFSPNATSGSNLEHYRTLAFNNLGAGKGEGIAGTPRYVWNPATNTSLDNGAAHQGGYSNGDYGRGGAANAAGGGNSHNAGGAGGANYGAGGRGGFGYRAGWDADSHLTAANDGGIGGYSLVSIGAGIINDISHRVFLGGGGGRGDANNNNTSVGGAGGGIVLVSARRVIGTGTIRANGTNGGNATNDGAGGGAGGGTVFLNVANSSTATINLIANGGNGGNVTHNDIHGPGGGGGGGAVFYYVPGATVNTTTNGGTSGTHSNWSNHGAGAGAGGSATNFTQIPNDLDRFNARCHVITNPMIRQKVK